MLQPSCCDHMLSKSPALTLKRQPLVGSLLSAAEAVALRIDRSHPKERCPPPAKRSPAFAEPAAKLTAQTEGPRTTAMQTVASAAMRQDVPETSGVGWRNPRPMNTQSPHAPPRVQEAYAETADPPQRTRHGILQRSTTQPRPTLCSAIRGYNSSFSSFITSSSPWERL